MIIMECVDNSLTSKKMLLWNIRDFNKSTETHYAASTDNE